ncbi:MAG TPA: metallophosphoesterase family protein [Usitatibacter sp.]|nr:metallophosphoesterase family protein [Usitatibacter sp.]
MAFYGVLGDIHGNLEALEAVLAALDARGVDRIACVGDIVGYNADPDACVKALRERQAIAIAGNHDLIGTGRLGFERCSNKAMHSLKRTRRAIAPHTGEYLSSLPAHHVLDERTLLIHGGVRDVQQYMTQPKHVVENVRYLREDFPGIRLCFFGHTHEQRVFEIVGEEVRAVPPSFVDLSPHREYFVNPGSVDASRKRSAKFAEYLVFDSEGLTLDFARVPYDDGRTEMRAEAGGYRISRWRERLYDVQRRLIRA